MSDSDPVQWRQSSRCDAGTCVEVATGDDEVLMRDSKDPEGPVLRFTRREWKAFVDSVDHGQDSAIP
jgi:hypothetical protein